VRTIWAVARQTYSQCLRMKIAAMFILLLAVFLAVLPTIMEGDGTLTGKVRTFLSYGMSATQLLLILVTIFTAAGVVSGDIRTKQIFTVASKPVRRWQYILGRWLGVVLLDVVLLALAGVACYAMTQYLRSSGRPINAEDHRALEADVFSARSQVRPDPVDVESLVQQRIAQAKKDGRYESAIEELKTLTGGDAAAAEQRLIEEIRKQEIQKLQSVSPGATKWWTFSGIDVAGQTRRGSGTVTGRNRSGTVLRIRADERLVARMIRQSPIGIDGLTGRITSVGWDDFVVALDPRQLRQTPRRFENGQQVQLTVEPSIQVRYTLKPSMMDVPGNVLKSEWLVQNPSISSVYYLQRKDDPVDSATTLTVPSRVVDSHGKTAVRYRNLPNPATNFATSVSIERDDMAVLFQAGGFDGNFVRALALIALQLVFLAALGVMAGTFASFPVASFVCLAVLPFGLSGQFVTEALKLDRGVLPSDPIVAFGYIVMKAMRHVLPNLAAMSPSQYLVDGIYISPVQLGTFAAWTLGVHTLIVLLLACAIFQRRELATAQV